MSDEILKRKYSPCKIYMRKIPVSRTHTPTCFPVYPESSEFFIKNPPNHLDNEILPQLFISRCKDNEHLRLTLNYSEDYIFVSDSFSCHISVFL